MPPRAARKRPAPGLAVTVPCLCTGGPGRGGRAAAACPGRSGARARDEPPGLGSPSRRARNLGQTPLLPDGRPRHGGRAFRVVASRPAQRDRFKGPGRGKNGLPVRFHLPLPPPYASVPPPRAPPAPDRPVFLLYGPLRPFRARPGVQLRPPRGWRLGGCSDRPLAAPPRPRFPSPPPPFSSFPNIHFTAPSLPPRQSPTSLHGEPLPLQPRPRGAPPPPPPAPAAACEREMPPRPSSGVPRAGTASRARQQRAAARARRICHAPRRAAPTPAPLPRPLPPPRSSRQDEARRRVRAHGADGGRGPRR